ncbi:hypothetical protein AMATHDRAFT_8724 [Amanita thiersii Skay4041]|uniref:Fatty acid hydroxylase domain-containing protein n=1 Tax=Amanita thiersii Skay4041 TaxID=703135 RepID=A0A2A9ND94_9AGAR|nr:hypothetical protein AMATHDRAFT_8724 [Amanita thiersii Skay4041]
MNTSISATTAPFYYSHKHTLVQGVPDRYVALASPIIAYWSLSMFFHCLDISGWKWLDRYRIHESQEVKSRNLVSRTHVACAVLFQQVVQTLLGLVWMSEENETINYSEQMQSITRVLQTLLPVFFSEHTLYKAAYLLYWWLIPATQLLFAMFVIDTWQYFLHRLMHTNKFLYKHFHSWHHRLYVPYAYGSLYNHPVEGFLLDSLGAGIAELISKLTTRQAMLLFIFSTLKTVDDHCGYNLPFDPLQLITSNNADYHDIHHQGIGIKHNFAQPFFVHWDAILGTRLTRHDIEVRRRQTVGKKD